MLTVIVAIHAFGQGSLGTIFGYRAKYFSIERGGFFDVAWTGQKGYLQKFRSRDLLRLWVSRLYEILSVETDRQGEWLSAGADHQTLI